MDFQDTKRHAEFVRLDVAAIVFILLIASIINVVLYDTVLAIALATIAFMLVGITVAWKWNQELTKHNVVELEPFTSALSGGIAILILQTLFGMYALYYPLLVATVYGMLATISYLVLIGGVAVFRLPEDDYKTAPHPDKNINDGTQYVWSEDYYIETLEDAAVNNNFSEQ